jgi:hypothetical protein
LKTTPIYFDKETCLSKYKICRTTVVEKYETYLISSTCFLKVVPFSK